MHHGEHQSMPVTVEEYNNAKGGGRLDYAHEVDDTKSIAHREEWEE